eukprot:ANDGO_04110.mRNA.1 hypothetical protein
MNGPSPSTNEPAGSDASDDPIRRNHNIITKFSGSPSMMELSAKDAVTGIVKMQVRKDRFAMFNEWLNGLTEVMRKYPGFISRSLIVPSKQELERASSSQVFTLVHIVKFDKLETLESWKESDGRREMVRIAEELKIVENPRGLTNGEDYSIQDSGMGILSPDMMHKTGSDAHQKSGKSSDTEHQTQLQPPQKWRLMCVLFFTMYTNYAFHLLLGTTAVFSRVFGSYGIALLVYCTCIIPPGSFGFVALTSRLARKFLAVPRNKNRSWIRGLLDDGFSMFEPALPSRDLINRIALLEKRLERMKRIAVGSVESVSHVRNRLEHLERKRISSNVTCSSAAFDPLLPPDWDVHLQRSRGVMNSQKQLPGLDVEIASSLSPSPNPSNAASMKKNAGVDTSVTIVSNHPVAWEFTEAFEDLMRHCEEQMRVFPGFISLDLIHTNGSLESLDDDHSHRSVDDLDQNSLGEDGSGDESEYVLIYRFDSYDALDVWLRSEQRRTILQSMKPMLAGRSRIQVQQAEVVHDAFSSLFGDRHNQLQGRPPPIWKSVVLSVFSVFFALWPLAVYLLPATSSSSNDVLAHKFVSALVLIAAAVPFLVYVTSPFMNMLFFQWLITPRPVFASEPWKSLDQGLPSAWHQLALSILYFGSLSVGILVLNFA